MSKSAESLEPLTSSADLPERSGRPHGPFPSLPRKRLLRDYVRHSRELVLLSVPFLSLGVIPFLLLDLFVSVDQTVCFPSTGFLRRGAPIPSYWIEVDGPISLVSG